MDLEKMLEELGLDESFYNPVSPGWNDSLLEKPNSIAFLQPENIKSNMELCNLPDKYLYSLREAAAKIAASAALSNFAWHCYYQLFEDRIIETFTEWPQKGQDGILGKIYLLVALAMAPEVEATHRELGIPENITRDTCQQVNCFCNNYIQGGTGIGLLPRQLAWLRQYVAGTLFRLGRMEYKLRKVENFGKVFKNRETGKVVALSKDGVTYNGKGFVDGTGDVFDKENAWTASYVENDKSAEGYLISPCGYALNKKMALPLDKWECVIKEGDTILDMHIPSGGGMKPEACVDSMRRAVEFFAEYFPEQKTSAVMCRSWIFNTQFEEKLPESNLAKFMRELYLFPILSSGRDGFFFVFCREYDDLSKAPRDTSLQRAMLDVLESGDQLMAGGMFILNDDLQYFGSQHYRKD